MRQINFKPIVFFKEVKAEMARVSWPTKQEAIRLTGIVIGVSLVVGLFIGSLDLLFTKIMETIIKK